MGENDCAEVVVRKLSGCRRGETNPSTYMLESAEVNI